MGSLKRDFLDIYLTKYFGDRKLKNTSSMRAIWKFRKLKKKLEIIVHFWENCIWKCCYKFSRLRREYLLSSLSGLTNSNKILHISQRDFLTIFAFAGAMNMIKVPPSSLEQCFGPFTVLLVKGSSETGLFRHLSNHVFWSP